MERKSLVFFAICLASSQTAQATPFYSAEAGVLSNSNHQIESGAAPVSANAGALQTFSMCGETGKWAGESSAAAGAGFLHGSSHTLVNITDHQCSLGSGTKAGGTHAVMTIDDVVITGAGGSVAGVLNLDFHGSLDAQANFANALGGSGSYAQVAITIGLPGGGGSGGARLGASAPPQDTLTLTNSGLLSGYSGGLLHLAIASDALPVNTAFSITLVLDTETLATYSVGGTGPNSVPILAEAFSNYENTFSFALNGPVFTLPDGYTVNSDAGAISDNRYVGLLQVPEPSSFLILCVGISYLCGTRRNRSS